MIVPDQQNDGSSLPTATTCDDDATATLTAALRVMAQTMAARDARDTSIANLLTQLETLKGGGVTTCPHSSSCHVVSGPSATHQRETQDDHLTRSSSSRKMVEQRVATTSTATTWTASCDAGSMTRDLACDEPAASPFPVQFIAAAAARSSSGVATATVNGGSVVASLAMNDRQQETAADGRPLISDGALSPSSTTPGSPASPSGMAVVVPSSVVTPPGVCGHSTACGDGGGTTDSAGAEDRLLRLEDDNHRLRSEVLALQQLAASLAAQLRSTTAALV